jgi:hypothetical protein
MRASLVLIFKIHLRPASSVSIYGSIGMFVITGTKGTFRRTLYEIVMFSLKLKRNVVSIASDLHVQALQYVGIFI